MAHHTSLPTRIIAGTVLGTHTKKVVDLRADLAMEADAVIIVVVITIVEAMQVSSAHETITTEEAALDTDLNHFCRLLAEVKDREADMEEADTVDHQAPCHQMDDMEARLHDMEAVGVHAMDWVVAMIGITIGIQHSGKFEPEIYVKVSFLDDPWVPPSPPHAPKTKPEDSVAGNNEVTGGKRDDDRMGGSAGAA
ncbi:hypothetical protein BC830DRAFT_80161 [Chytriomyces sp. MP71]|nr:hypothetical protein BC830DRAFT_80161 [Chytriomyces sp. MP71]